MTNDMLDYFKKHLTAENSHLACDVNGQYVIFTGKYEWDNGTIHDKQEFEIEEHDTIPVRDEQDTLVDELITLLNM